jgi:hypothetical protein
MAGFRPELEYKLVAPLKVVFVVLIAGSVMTMLAPGTTRSRLARDDPSQL